MTPIEELMRDIVLFHDGQVRKGTGVPYAVHPIMVMNKIAEWGIIEYDMQAAALLHDVLEDTIYTNVEAHIESYGMRAMQIVQELTFTGTKEEKVQYLAKFGDSTEKSVEALVIKVADRICNVRDFMVNDFHYAGKYHRKADALWEAFRDRQQEIIDRFGLPVQNRMNGDIWNLREDFDG